MSIAAPPLVAPTHRERKKQATRQAIHRAAFDLVEEQGLPATTIEAISERAGVAPRTFWAYFPSKEDAVINRDPDRPGALRSALLDRPAGEDVTVSLKAVLAQSVSDANLDRETVVRRYRLIRREPQLMAAVAAVFDEYERELVSAVAERLGVDPSTDMRPAVLVTAACGACRVAQHFWVDSDGRRPFTDLLDSAFAHLAEGAAPVEVGR